MVLWVLRHPSFRPCSSVVEQQFCKLPAVCSNQIGGFGSYPDKCMKHYVYKITFPGMPWFYYGVHTDNGRPYFGSPKTHKWRWDFYEHEITVLEWFETREEADTVEKRIIAHFLNDVNCLNECAGGKFSLESLRRGAKTRNQLPVKESTKQKIGSATKSRWAKLTPEQRLEQFQTQGMWCGTPPEEKERVREAQIRAFAAINHQQGERNSQFGTMWVTNGRENRKIKRDCPIPEGYHRGRTLN